MTPTQPPIDQNYLMKRVLDAERGNYYMLGIMIILCLLMLYSFNDMEELRQENSISKAKYLFLKNSIMVNLGELPITGMQENKTKQKLRSPGYVRCDDSVEMDYKGRFVYTMTSMGTGSMLPLITPQTVFYSITPQNMSEIKIGDLIIYEPDWTESNSSVLHRVIEKDIDESGIYVRTKGDNNYGLDPQKIRFENITFLVIGTMC